MYGDSLRDFVVGFVVVEPATCKAYAEKKGIKFDKDMLASEEFKIEVMKDLYALASQYNLNSLEKPKQIYLDMDAWTE